MCYLFFAKFVDRNKLKSIHKHDKVETGSKSNRKGV